MSLTAEQVNNIRQWFTEGDTDHDGKLNTEEIKELCLKMDWDCVTVPAAIRAFDKDGDKEISLQEFLEYSEMKASHNAKALFQKLFEAIDVNHNHTIDIAEMIEFSNLVGQPITPEEAQEQLEGIDTDNDKRVTFDELWEIFKDCEF